MSLKLLSNMDNIGETMKSIANKLIPNWISFVIQLSSFLILLLVVFFVAYKPVKRMMQKRADHIENEIKQAEEKNVLAAASVNEAKELVSSSKLKASEIIKNAEVQGQEKYDVIILEAKQEVADMKKAAEEDIERAKEDAIQDIRSEMVNVALSASKEILKREVDKKDNVKLAEDFIDQLN